MSKRMHILKRLASSVVIALTALAVTLTVLKALWDASYYRGYDSGLPLNVTLREDLPYPADEPRYRRVSLTFEGCAGQAVPAVGAWPLGGQGPSPCIVFLHGIGQEKEFLVDFAGPLLALPGRTNPQAINVGSGIHLVAYLTTS